MTTYCGQHYDCSSVDRSASAAHRLGVPLYDIAAVHISY